MGWRWTEALSQRCAGRGEGRYLPLFACPLGSMRDSDLHGPMAVGFIGVQLFLPAGNSGWQSLAKRELPPHPRRG